MQKRLIWEKREVSFVDRYQVVGERLFREDREDGWYVSSWSDSAPIVGCWVAGGRFYQASINWVTGSIINLEINREIELGPERIRITLEAIDRWKSHADDRALQHATIDESAFHLVAA